MWCLEPEVCEFGGNHRINEECEVTPKMSEVEETGKSSGTREKYASVMQMSHFHSSLISLRAYLPTSSYRLVGESNTTVFVLGRVCAEKYEMQSLLPLT